MRILTLLRLSFCQIEVLICLFVYFADASYRIWVSALLNRELATWCATLRMPDFRSHLFRWIFLKPYLWRFRHALPTVQKSAVGKVPVNHYPGNSDCSNGYMHRLFLWLFPISLVFCFLFRLLKALNNSPKAPTSNRHNGSNSVSSTIAVQVQITIKTKSSIILDWTLENL